MRKHNIRNNYNNIIILFVNITAGNSLKYKTIALFRRYRVGTHSIVVIRVYYNNRPGKKTMIN